MLIVSGVGGSRNADAEGVVAGSWYDRLRQAELHHGADLAVQGSGAEDDSFALALFDPPILAGESVPAGAPLQSQAIDEGILLHGLMERLTQGSRWPIRIPAADAVAHWLACPLEVARIVREQAAAILGNAALAHFFDPARYVAAHNEMEIAFDGAFLRFDRFVQFDSECWILDYKRQLLPGEREAYRAQLGYYRAAAQELYAGCTIRTALLLTDGSLHEDI
jgi:ATP-dependent helicase/nuclease subunit A